MEKVRGKGLGLFFTYIIVSFRWGFRLVKAFSLEKIKGWHQPIEQVIGDTDLTKISATPVFDRGNYYSKTS